MLMDAIEKVFPQAVCKQEVCRRSFSEDFFFHLREVWPCNWVQFPLGEEPSADEWWL